MDFNRSNPAIASFNRGVQQHEQSRRADDQDFQRRATYERGVQGDAAVRKAIGDFYSQQGGGQQVLPVNAGPGGMVVMPPNAPVAGVPAAPPNGTVLPAGPQPSGAVTAPVGGGGAPQARPLDAPAPPSMLPSGAGEFSGTGRGDAPLPPSGAGEFGQEAPQLQPQPAPNGAPPAEAAPAGSAANGARPQSRYAPLMSALSQAPGAGGQMISMFQRDVQDQNVRAVEDRRIKAEGSKMMLAALKDGDVRLARATAQQYGINIPDEVWKNRSVVMSMRTAANLAKTLGIKDEHAVDFTHGYVEAMAGGAQEDQAMLAGLKKVPRDSFEVKGHYTDENNVVQFYDKRGNTRESGGTAARPLAGRTGGAGGGETATIRNRNDMANRINQAYPGIDAGLVQKLVINPRANITPQDVMKQRNAMQKAVDGLGRPLYKTTQELDNAVRQVLEGAKSMAGYVAPAAEPAPGAPNQGAPAPQGPSGNKRMRFNPRTQQLEEVNG